MKFIVLIGKDNTGKTTTLKTVVYKLLAQQMNVINDPQGYRLGSYAKTAADVFVPETHDLTLVLKDTKKNMLIGITTYGDAVTALRNKIQFFMKVGCDCIICASHPTGTSASYIQELKKDPTNQIVEIKKIGCFGDDKDWKYNNLCNILDGLVANEIISHI